VEGVCEGATWRTLPGERIAKLETDPLPKLLPSVFFSHTYPGLLIYSSYRRRKKFFRISLRYQDGRQIFPVLSPRCPSHRRFAGTCPSVPHIARYRLPSLLIGDQRPYLYSLSGLWPLSSAPISPLSSMQVAHRFLNRFKDQKFDTSPSILTDCLYEHQLQPL
jgi:hypothetical protein